MIADRTLSHHTPRPRTRLRLPPLHTPYIILASSGELSPLDEAMVMIGTVCKDQAQQTFVDAGYTDVKLETVGSSALNSEGNVETTYQMVPLTCDNFGGELKQLFINAISMCVEVKADQVQLGDCNDVPTRRRRLGLGSGAVRSEINGAEDTSRTRRRAAGTAMQMGFEVTFERTMVSGLAEASSCVCFFVVPALPLSSRRCCAPRRCGSAWLLFPNHVVLTRTAMFFFILLPFRPFVLPSFRPSVLSPALRPFRPSSPFLRSLLPRAAS